MSVSFVVIAARTSKLIQAIHSDGMVRNFTVPNEAGGVMYVCCGADQDYAKNDVYHAHYLGFERDLYVYDGKYLQRIGHK